MKRNLKTLMVSVMVMLMVLTSLAGCGTSPNDNASAGGSEDGGAVAKDKAVLVVSFGTSYNDSRDLTIVGIEGAIQKAFPDYDVRRAFTSQIIIDKLAERDNLKIDNVKEALDRAADDGIKTLVVQPTHLMNGYEYTDLKDELAGYADAFDKIVMGEPLLTSDADFEAVAQAITAQTASYDDGETAIVFMGHGTEADSNGVYAKMQEVLAADGYNNYFVGTVEATPSLEDVMAEVAKGGAAKDSTASAMTPYKKVVLEPLMVVAGDHANNDMAGDEDDSWKSQFEAAGYDVSCILEGLGQYESIQKIYVEHTQAAIDTL